MLHQFHDNFNSHLDQFMSALQDESHSEVPCCCCCFVIIAFVSITHFFALLIPCVRSIISICQTCVLDWTSTAFIGPRVSKLSLFSLLFFRLHMFLFQTAISHHNVLFPSLNVTQIMVLYFILPPNLIV